MKMTLAGFKLGSLEEKVRMLTTWLPITISVCLVNCENIQRDPNLAKLLATN